MDDLQRRGYLERIRDPSDGRARLIRPTVRGADALAQAGRQFAEIETRWGDLVGADGFDQACRTLDRLLSAIDPDHG